MVHIPDSEVTSLSAAEHVHQAVDHLREALLVAAPHDGGGRPVPDPSPEILGELARLVQLAAVTAHVAVGRRSTDAEEAAVRFTQALLSLRGDPVRDD